MSDIAIKVENLSKAYQLGKIGTGTISRDLERFFITKILGKEDPFLKVGQTNDRTIKGTSDIVWSLKDINFEINQGDAVGIIGKNGAGKSTLLKLLSRVTSPTTGDIKIKGRVASLLEVGTGFHPELSGRENVYLNGAILGMRKAEIKRKFDEIVDFAGVERYIDTPVKRYSSGMYVRLAFAVAAHLESEILIVDEVLAVGDAEFQKKCLGKMGDISKGEGRTILFVSHNMSAIKEFCNVGLVLENGKITNHSDIKTAVDYYSLTQNVQLKDIANIENHSGLKTYSFISSFEVFNKNNLSSKNYFNMGDTILIKIRVKIFKTMENAEIGVKLSSIGGVALSYYVSEWEGHSYTLKAGEHEFNVEIPNITYLPNKYYLSPWVLVKGQAADDYVDSAVLIEVFKSDINGHKAYFDKYSYSGCEIYLPSDWKKQ